MQYSTPVPSNRVSAPFTSESARPAVQNSGHLFEQSASVYPSLQAYETSLTTQKAPANIRNPFSSGQRKANHQHASSSQPLESQPAQAPALTQQTRQQASAPASHSKEQKYAVQVSSQALRLSRARSNFTTLRYNIVYALALYFLSSSRPYRMLKHIALPREAAWHSGALHAENALLALFVFNILYASWRLWTLPPVTSDKVTMTLSSPIKNNLSSSSSQPFDHSAFRQSTPFASSPISKPIVSAYSHASPSQSSPQQPPHQHSSGSPFRSPGSNTPTSKLRAALLSQQHNGSVPARDGSPAPGSPHRQAALLGLGMPGSAPNQQSTPVRDDSLRERAFLSRHSPSDSPRRVMSGKAALQAVS